MQAEVRLARLLKLLQGTIRAAGHTQTDIDDRIGRRRGYLSHVFQRRVDLKLVDLLRALEALEIDPHRFFGAAFGAPATARRPLDSLMHLASYGEGNGLWHEPRSGNGATQDDREFLARVRQAVRSILSETNGAVSAQQM